MASVDNFKANSMTQSIISPQYKTQQQDGAGRNSYMNAFKAGLHMKDLSSYMPSNLKEEISHIKVHKTRIQPRPYDEPRIVHYISDGSGRDTYVCKNDGGQTSPYHWRDHYQFKFQSSLRSQSFNKRVQSPYDKSKFSQSFMNSHLEDSYVSKLRRQSQLNHQLSRTSDSMHMKKRLKNKVPDVLKDFYKSYYIYPEPKRQMKPNQ